jgi:hypothetical protein
MNRHRVRYIAMICAGILTVWACAASNPPPVAPASAWNPISFGGEQALEFLTVGTDEGEHWSRVWLVTIDGQLYVRLGTRAAGRIERNTSTPYVEVRIADQQFDRVRVEPAPEATGKVAAAMAQKYWSDFMVRGLSHPLTARLIGEQVPHV